MPAVLAHWAVAKDVAWRFINRKKTGYSLFKGKSDDRQHGISRYVYMGANGPDLPYFRHMIRKKTRGVSEWADLFHYNKQAEFVLQLVKYAKQNVTSDKDRRERDIAYALGHTTHILADVNVHPYVNLYAGAYHSQVIADIHKTSELHQDSWLAQKYYGRSHVDDGESWTKYVPPCIQIGLPGVGGYTQIHGETKDVLRDINTAFVMTHGKGPGFTYLKDCYERFYDLVLDEEYDKAMLMVPRNPHKSLVFHDKIKHAVPYYPQLLRNKAVSAAEKACEAVIELYYSGFSDSDLNTFRSKVQNWNMDTGYRLEVELKGNNLKIVWKHSWV